MSFVYKSHNIYHMQQQQKWVLPNWIRFVLSPLPGIKKNVCETLFSFSLYVIDQKKLSFFIKQYQNFV